MFQYHFWFLVLFFLSLSFFFVFLGRFWHFGRMVMIDQPLAVFPNINEGVSAANFVPGSSHGEFVQANIGAPTGSDRLFQWVLDIWGGQTDRPSIFNKNTNNKIDNNWRFNFFDYSMQYWKIPAGVGWENDRRSKQHELQSRVLVSCINWHWQWQLH